MDSDSQRLLPSTWDELQLDDEGCKENRKPLNANIQLTESQRRRHRQFHHHSGTRHEDRSGIRADTTSATDEVYCPIHPNVLIFHGRIQLSRPNNVDVEHARYTPT